MLDLKKGEIILCQSGLKIDRYLTIDKLETDTDVQLIRKKDVKTGYIWYSIWADIEGNEYIQVSLCFSVRNQKSKLCRVDIYPHIQKTNPIDAKMYFNNIDKVSESVKIWFSKYCDTPRKVFSWGEVFNIHGDPNIDPSVVLMYK